MALQAIERLEKKKEREKRKRRRTICLTVKKEKDE